MAETKLIPYSCYLTKECHDKLRKQAKNRKASSFVRDAIVAMLDGGDIHKAGYNQGLKDAVTVIDNCIEIKPFAFNGKYLTDTVADQILELRKK